MQLRFTPTIMPCTYCILSGELWSFIVPVKVDWYSADASIKSNKDLQHIVWELNPG